MTDRFHSSVRFAASYGAFFLFVGLYLPFWPAWLKSRGIDEAEIGLLLAAALWVRIAASPAIAHWADRHGQRKSVILWGSVAAAAGYFLYLPADGFWALLAITLLVHGALSGVVPLTENLAMLAVDKHGIDYGRVRLWGSLTFIAAASIGGWVLTDAADTLILWLLIAMLWLSALANAALPNIRPPPAAPGRAPLRLLLTDRGFLAFVLCASLAQASHAVYYGFATLHWRAAGHSDLAIGLLWAEGVIAEVILFAFSRRILSRIGPARLFAAAGLAGLVRWTVLGTTTDLTALFAVNALHAFTFGAAHLAAMHFIARAVPVDLSASAQSLYAALSAGAVMAIAMMGAGWLFEHVQGAAFYAMAVLSTAAGLMACLAGWGRGLEPIPCKRKTL